MDARKKRRRNRLVLISSAGAVLAVALALVLYALNDQITFFQSPSDIAEKSIPAGQRLRLGGLVKEATFVRDGQKARFVVTDTAHDIKVNFTGILPDLFREGQGIIAEGALDETGTFIADNVMAKHDENYMPREVADALKKQGHWQGEEGEEKTQ